MGKKDIKSVVVFVVVIVLVIVGILCFKSVMEAENEYKTIETTIAKVQEESIEDSKTIVLEKGDAGEVKTVTSNNKNTDSKDNSSKYDSQNLPNINLSKVREINKDVVGWLYVPNTNINYPILKGTSNDSYIKTDIYKRKSSAGSIFMDYQNDSKFYDKNTIIYGHNMKNKSMFHNLRYFLNKSFRQKNSNIYIYTDTGILEYEIQNAKTVKKTDKIYTPAQADFEEKFILEESNFNSKEEIYNQYMKVYKDNQIVLSTCHQKNDRNIVIAKFSNIYLY